MSAATAKTFEAKMARLEAIVHALESGDPSLAEGMALYKEGADCSRFCREQLEKARHELLLWQDGEARALNPEAVNSEALTAETSADNGFDAVADKES